jgi:hypothetical protein
MAYVGSRPPGARINLLLPIFAGNATIYISDAVATTSTIVLKNYYETSPPPSATLYQALASQPDVSAHDGTGRLVMIC